MAELELMGRNQYAKYRGCTPNAVSKAVKDGRITKAVIWEGGQIKAIKWRLADQLWRANTDPARVPISSAPAPAAAANAGRSPAVQTAALAAEQQAQAWLGGAFAGGFVWWAGLLVHRYNIEADRAAEMITDLHLMLAIAISSGMGVDPDDASVLITGELKAYLSPDERPALLERIASAAEVFDDGKSQGDQK